MKHVINTEGLTKFYGSARGIADVDLAISQGEIFGFLGPNGAGKTTTIRLLLGLILPSAGRATVLGRDISEGLVPVMEEIGYIPGDVRLYPKMTGKELLAYFARFKPNRPPKLRDELVRRFDLDVSRRVSDYSRGNRQKLALVAAFMHEPSLLVLDEPTLGLDPLMQREFYQMLREVRDRGAAVFLSSHILGEIERVSDRVAVIREGRLIAVEPVERIIPKKLYNVDVTLAEQPAAGLFDIEGITKLEQTGLTFRLAFKGELDPLIKALGRARVTTMTLTQMSLEELFFEYYEKEEPQ
jgi:ABC-2 type transport system ATP-binding protein